VSIKRLFLLSVLAILRAESPVDIITGRVMDESGAALVDAEIRLSGKEKKSLVGRSSVTGEFQFQLEHSEAGDYELSVQAQGFQSYKRLVQVIETREQHFEIKLAVEGSILSITVTETAGYRNLATSTATKVATPVLNLPQSISMINSEQIRDQAMMSMADVVRYVPGITMAQGEGHRDAPIIRGNATTADFFINGVRDDVQYFRDLYNLESVEALKGPNAMVFGRGGGGGVLNRVTKEALFSPLREVSVQGGSFGNKRMMADIAQPINNRAAFRMNTMFEDSGSFRQYGDLRRYGVSPTLTLRPSETTKVRLSYERFHDGRLVDRGIPSYRGLPLAVDRRQYFGNPDVSRARADVNLGSVIVEQQLGLWNLRNQTLFGAYDKYYGNVFPGAVNAARTQVSLSAYDDATNRNNFFNQTDLSLGLKTGKIRHTLLAGVEVGRQLTNNLRNTGYFGNTSTTILVPIENAVDLSPVTFRQSATDANNQIRARVGAGYVQDQIELSRFVQVVAGLRFDYFDLRAFNRRTTQTLGRGDKIFSPRLGVVIKPVRQVSLYGNYSVSFLPSAGDQFGALTVSSQSLKPERFRNVEAGAKWDMGRGLSVSSAYYWLDRTNTSAPDPQNPAILVQTGSQRSKGLEFSLNGRLTRMWTVSGGYALQDARITSRTVAALPGARVAQVPRNSASLWNHFRLMPRLGAGLGLIHQGEMFAAIDNSVRIPKFARADAALFYSLSERLRLQANVENLTNRSYIVNGHNNNNLTPGLTRAVRAGLTVQF
jgi:catecholate siderophore receptor